MSALALKRFDGLAVARPCGDIDAANAAAIDEELASCLTPDATGLIVDLSDTRYLDSAGIDMLLRLAERLRQRRTELRIVVAPDSQLRRLFEIVGMLDHVRVHATVSDAMADIPRAAPDVSDGEASAPDIRG